MTKPAVALIACALCTVQILAAPLRKADLEPGCVWFVHLNFEYASPATQKLWAELPTIRHLAGLARETGFVPAIHMTGFTASGVRQEGQGTLVFRHKFPNEKLIAWLKQRKDVSVVQGEPSAASHFVVELGKTAGSANGARRYYLAFPAEGVFVLTLDTASLAGVIARLTVPEESAVAPQWPTTSYDKLLHSASSLLVAYVNFASMAETCGAKQPWLKRMREIALWTGVQGESLHIEILAQGSTRDIAREITGLLATYESVLAKYSPNLKLSHSTMPEDNSCVHLICTIAVHDFLKTLPVVATALQAQN